MSPREYFKDKLLMLLINLMLFIIVGAVMLLMKSSGIVVFLTFCIWFLPLLSYLLLDFLKHKRYYDKILQTLDQLEQKFLLPEVIAPANFIDGQIVCDILKEVSRDMHENVKYYRDMQEEYREYLEMWVHEIKTPIASTKLVIENNRNSITEKIDYQINKIEGFVEQVLYYSRSNEVNKDYLIKSFLLKTALMNVVKRNSKDFIQKKIKLEIGDIDEVIYSDIKWVEFIIHQILSNAIKYASVSEPAIKIHATRGNHHTKLMIEDNGVGIIDRDVNRVFEKGFTGENGRIYGKATGMGLYLCKELCKKLGLGIQLDSRINEGTKVTLIFPMNENQL